LALISKQAAQVELHIKHWFRELKQYNVITMEQLEYWQQQFSLFEARLFENEPSILASSQFSLNGKYFYIPFNKNGQLAFNEWEAQLVKLMGEYASLIEHANKQISI